MFGFWVSRALRLVEGDVVPVELRGWRWDEPPVRPRAYLGFGVSEIVPRYCGTFRDLWLRRVRGVRGDGSGSSLVVGRIVHEVFHAVSSDLREMLARGIESWKAVEALLEADVRGEWPEWADVLYRRLVVAWGGEVEERLFRGGSVWGIPWVTEVLVDGGLVGLSSRLRVDALEGSGVIVEVKLGGPRRDHVVVLAGYALALESQRGVPYNYGVIVHVYGVPGVEPRFEVRGYFIGEDARRRFLELRDEAIDVVLGGGEPPLDARCSRACPFYRFCHGGGGE